MAGSTLTYTHMMILIWVLWTVALGMTVFRGSFQWAMQRHLYLDDYFVFAGLLTLTALTAVITKMIPQFFLAAEYMKDAVVNPLTPLPLPPEEFAARTVASLKLMFTQMLLFWTTLWAAKFSILCFIRRLVKGLPTYTLWWWACFVVVTLLYLACMLSNFLTCKPLTRYWSPQGCSRPEDLPRADASIKFATAADVTADFLIMILPITLLRKLTVSRAHKFGLLVIFSLGAIIIAFAFIRLVQVTKATSEVTQDPTTLADGPVLLSMWSHIESSVAVIVATLPAFRFLINRNRNNSTGASSQRYSVPTIGGSGGSGVHSGSRKWRQGGSRLYDDGEAFVTSDGSQLELRPVRAGRIRKDTEIRVEKAQFGMSLDDKESQHTRHV